VSAGVHWISLPILDVVGSTEYSVVCRMIETQGYLATVMLEPMRIDTSASGCGNASCGSGERKLVHGDKSLSRPVFPNRVYIN